MKKTILLSVVIFLLTSITSYSQHSNSLEHEDTQTSIIQKTTDISRTPLRGALGVNAGLAFMESNTGIAVGVFAEIEAGSFAFVPQANYWQVKKENNFELCALARLKFPSLTIEPYIDGGIGINFYNNNDKDISFTKLGVDVGGGIEIKTVSTNFTLVVDGKYKIIINNDEPGNISGYIVTAGLKFPF